MAATVSVASSLSSLSSTHLNLPSITRSRPISCYSTSFFTAPNSSSPPLISSLTLSLHPQSKLQSFRLNITQNPINRTLIRKPRNFRASVAAEDAESTTEQIVSAASGDDGVSNIISILLFIAFIGLSILTIGVIYIAVTDFLQKREKEKFEKEEAAKKKKKSGKKFKARARAGPRGFGQKIDEDEDDSDD